MTRFDFVIVCVSFFIIILAYAFKLRKDEEKEEKKKQATHDDIEMYEHREILKPSYHGLCGLRKVKQRRLNAEYVAFEIKRGTPPPINPFEWKDVERD